MKTRLLIIFTIGIIGFTGISFAEESSGSPIPEPEQESFTYTNCGPGTTYQDGICVVDETENSNQTKNQNEKWSAAYQDISKDSEPEPPTISDEQDKMIQEYCETGIRHPDMMGIPQCIKNELVCGSGSELVDGVCHVIKYEKSDHMTPSIFLDGFFFMIFVSPFFIPGAIIFVVLSKTPRFSRGIRLAVCIPAIIMILYFLWGLLVGWYPPGYA